jgi:ammonium transporter, Amt family
VATHRRRRKLAAGVGVAAAAVLLSASPAFAQDEDPAAYTQFVLDNLWVMLAGVLVFFMQAGFGLVEAGMTRAKNVANIMAKNMTDMMVGVLVFFAVGFAFAYGGDGWFIGTEGFFLSGANLLGDGEGLTPATDFFFQVVFAATAATIVSGAMAERTKFATYIVATAIVVAFIYPVVVHWTWGGGLISRIEIGDAVFSDFAGSTIVHSVGGWAALMGAWMLGPRIGKYGPDGKPRPIPAHNIAFVVIGVFILTFGWFGFNAGSELAADELVMVIALNTVLSAAAGGFTAMMVVWARSGKPDVSMIANGILAGLVGITAGCATVNTAGALAIGAISGVLVVFSVIFFENRKIDDPVGAISVHGVCGVWGTLAIGIFARYDDAFLGRDKAGWIYGGGPEQLVVQFLMVVIVAAWVLVTSGIMFLVLKKTMGIRVSEEEEVNGLDVMEHGTPGYAPDALAHTSR